MKAQSGQHDHLVPPPESLVCAQALPTASITPIDTAGIALLHEATTSCSRALTTSRAPQRRAISSRCGATSLTMICSTPWACAAQRAQSPIGPAPRISSRSLWLDPRESDGADGTCQRLGPVTLRPAIKTRGAGSTGVPVRQHIGRTHQDDAPTSWRRRHRFDLPDKQRSQVPQTTSGLNVTRAPNRGCITRCERSSCHLHNLSCTFMSHDERRDSQTIVAEEAAQFGAADTHGTNRDQHLTLCWFWHRFITLHHLPWTQATQVLASFDFPSCLLLVFAAESETTVVSEFKDRAVHIICFYDISL